MCKILFYLFKHTVHFQITDSVFSFMTGTANLSHMYRNADQRGRKKTQPHAFTPKEPPMHTLTFPLLNFFICLNSLKENKKTEWHFHHSSCPRSAISLQPETNLFGKLRAVQNRTTHTASEPSTAGGWLSHTPTHTHTHKMAALTKISSTPRAAYEPNYNLLHGWRYCYLLQI